MTPPSSGPAAPDGGGTAGDVLLHCALGDAYDVFTVRQLGRATAEAVGLVRQDPIRVATALSEVGREVIEEAGAADVVFSVHRGTADPVTAGTPARAREHGGTAPALVIHVTWSGEPETAEPRRAGAAKPSGAVGRAVTAAGRLMDHVEWEGRRIVMAKRLSGPRLVDDAWIEEARRRAARTRPDGTLEELRRQNGELLAALEDLHGRQQELLRLNAELEETNRGVVALYGELSRELEETNSGVVALYGELEEKSGQLREAAEAKSRFWATVSHELRTPVNSVIGLARLLLDPGGDPLTAEQRRQAELIASSGSTLLAMVNELLDMAKAESGRVEPQFAWIDLPGVLSQVRGMMRPLLTSPEVELVIENPGDVPSPVSDEVMLTRILRNLLSNGLKFTERGEVRLTTTHDAQTGQIVMTVSDTGIGIPQNMRSRVFEEFYQVPGPLQQRFAGTGLGLPYARRLSRLLGGTLVLESEPDRGTTVTLRLPVRGDQPGSAPAKVATALIVDDDPVFREVFRGVSQGVIGRLLEAPGGEAAMTMAAADPPDVLFVDLQMPGVDGFALLRRLAAHPKLSGIPVVVVTATDPAEYASRPEVAGAFAMLPKSGLTAGRLSHVLAALPRGGAEEEDR